MASSPTPPAEDQEHDQLDSSNENEDHDADREHDENGAGTNPEGTPAGYPHYYGYGPGGTPGSPSAGGAPSADGTYPNAYWNAGYIGIPMPMHVPVAPGVGANGKPKRKQVKNACTNCQTACKRCDDERPCGRCVKYGLSDTCLNSARKERKKGIKRGPYKKRKESEEDMDNLEEGSGVTPGMEGIIPPGAHPYSGQLPPGYPEGYYSYYPGFFQQTASGHLVPTHGDGEEGEEGDEEGGGEHSSAVHHYPYMYPYYAAQAAPESGDEKEEAGDEGSPAEPPAVTASPSAPTPSKKGKKKAAAVKTEPSEKPKRGKKRKAAVSPPPADDYEDED